MVTAALNFKLLLNLVPGQVSVQSEAGVPMQSESLGGASEATRISQAKAKASGWKQG